MPEINQPEIESIQVTKLIPLYLGAMITPMGGVGVVTLIPVISLEWSLPFSLTAMVIPFYMIPFIVVQIFSGSMAQLFGERGALLAGFTIYALGSLLCGLAPDLAWLLGSRVVQGIGAGFAVPICMAMIGELVPLRHVGKAMGVLGLFYTSGITLGPLISGLLEIRYGWTAFFYFLGTVSLCACLLYLASSRPRLRTPGQRAGLSELLATLAQALAQPGTLLLGFAAFFLFVGFIGIMTFTAQFLKASHNLPTDKIGVLLSATGLAGILISPLAGWLGDRFGKNRVLLAGGSLASGAIVLMALLPYTYSGYLVLFLIFGTGSAMAWTILNTIAVELSPVLRKPVTSVYTAIKFTGYAAAPLMLSFLWDRFHLTAVQWGCLAAVLVAMVLALAGHARAQREAAG